MEAQEESSAAAEDDLYTAAGTVKDMRYTMSLLLSLGLFLELAMEVEVDIMGALHLVINSSVSGRTRHINTKQCYLQ